MTLAPAVPAHVDPATLAGAAAALAATGPLTFLVGGQALSYQVENGTVVTREQAAGQGTAVRLHPLAWADLTAQVRTMVNLQLSGDLTFEAGSFEQLAAWDPVLKYLHAGIPPYDPGRADLGGRDPGATLTLDAGDDELRAQLSTMGFLHVAGVFTAEEMAAADAEVDRLAALARPGDEQSWWATAEQGEEVLCRLVYASQRSALLASFEQDPRVRRLGTLLDPRLRTAPDRMEGLSVLLKVPGRTAGLSNIPWHTDCGMGGHAIFCPSVLVGIQLTGSTPETGNLLMVPGSHGQTMPLGWDRTLGDVPVVAVDTRPGDVTVHVADVMHASPRPTGAGGRRTMYVDHYPPALWEHIGPGEAYNDLVRNRTQQVARLR
jgi:hypothetical protein